MRLSSGTRLGGYEILAPLGAGGMGEVYRARDTKLDRDVALKILPEVFARDPDRVARFTREAHVLASLNDPHIAQVYGFDEGSSADTLAANPVAVRFLVMELVEGEDLAQRLARGPIPMDEALPIARQVATALEAAHEQGVVHRDLKPANIKVRPDGTVKVLDFGLAKALESMPAMDMTAAPTITSPAMTQMGMILGTAAYMSPEQAKGRQADKRSDVWAFGAVLYEMLAGHRAFKGDDVSDTLAAVLRQEIDWTVLPGQTPVAVRRLIARCLDRDVRGRLRDIGEARIALESSGATLTGDAGTPALATAKRGWRRVLPVVLSAISAAALTGAAGWYVSSRSSIPSGVARFSFTLPEGLAFSALGVPRHMIALSPDGSQIVYAAATRLYLRPMPQLDAKSIQGTEGSLTDPVFSPDGRWVAFFAPGDQTIKKIAVTGGAALTICPAASLYGMSWGSEGIVFGQGNRGIMQVSPDGGAPNVRVRVRDGEEAQGPQVLPGGEHVLFTLATGTSLDRWDKARIVVESLKSGERTSLIEGGSDARYVPTGHIVYALGGSLYAVAFDPQRLRVTGEPVPIVEGVRRAPGSLTGGAHFSFSNNGSLIYVPGPVSISTAFLEIALIDRTGRVEVLKLPPGPYLMPRVDPEGARIAFGTDDGKEAIVWIYDVHAGTAMRRLTFGGNNRFPIWSADGKRVAFQSDRDGDLAIFSQPADGAGSAERLTTPDQGTLHVPESWSPKGDRFLYSVTKGSDLSLWTFSMQDRKATPFDAVHSPNVIGALFSPDGRWVAYTSAERGLTTISVQPFPVTGARSQLLPAKEGDSPHMVVWSPDGRELFYDPRPGGFEAVSVTTHPTFTFGNPVAVPHPFQLGPPSARRAYDITRSGKFVGLLPAGQKEFLTPIAPQIEIVLNWFEELKARVPQTKP